MKDEILKLAKDGNETELLLLIKGTRFYSDAIKKAAKFKHTQLIYKLYAQLGFNPHDASASLTIPQLDLLSSAIEGYSSGLHFDEVKQMVSLGGNIFHGLNALVSEGLLTTENALKLIGCGKDEAQKTRLCDKIEKTYNITCHGDNGISEINDTATRATH